MVVLWKYDREKVCERHSLQGDDKEPKKSNGTTSIECVPYIIHNNNIINSTRNF